MIGEDYQKQPFNSMSKANIEYGSRMSNFEGKDDLIATDETRIVSFSVLHSCLSVPHLVSRSLFLGNRYSMFAFIAPLPLH